MEQSTKQKIKGRYRDRMYGEHEVKWRVGQIRQRVKERGKGVRDKIQREKTSRSTE